MLVREMKVEDCLEVATIHTLSWQWAYKGIIDQKFLDSLDIQKRAAAWKMGIETGAKMIRLIVEDQNGILGFASGLENRTVIEMPQCDAELWAIYVHPELSRKGAGAALLNHFKNELRAVGKTKLCIWALRDNLKARAFYEKQGGVAVAFKDFKINDQVLPEVGYEFSL